MAHTTFNRLMHRWVYGDPATGQPAKHTLESLAGRTGIDHSTISDWAHGRSNPTWRNLHAMGWAVEGEDLQAMITATFPRAFDAVDHDLDLNHDGVVDGRDLTDAAVGHVESAPALLRRALEALKDGRVSPDEHVRIAAACAQCVALIETVGQIAAQMAASQPRRRRMGVA